MQDYFQSVAQPSLKFHTGVVNWPQRLKYDWLLLLLFIYLFIYLKKQQKKPKATNTAVEQKH